MPIIGEKIPASEDGSKKDELIVHFTNGALTQLESLKTFIGADDVLDVIKAGISFIQGVKERKEKSNLSSDDRKE